MKYKNEIAIVAGGTGDVGEGVVLSLLKESFIVVVPSRSSDKEKKLKQYANNHSNLYLFDTEHINGDYNEQLIEWTIKSFGKIDLAVASLGGWHQGSRLDQMSTDDWLKIVNDNLNSHFHFAKAIVSYYHRIEKGMLIMINGGSAEKILKGAGSMTIFSNAQLTMTKVLASESKENNIKIHSVMAMTPVKTRSRAYIQKDWLSTKEIGEYIIGLYKNPSEEILHKIP